MKSAKEWNEDLWRILHPDPDHLTVQLVKRIQANAIEHAITMIEEDMRHWHRVDSSEAQTIRNLNCRLRDEVRRLLCAGEAAPDHVPDTTPTPATTNLD